MRAIIGKTRIRRKRRWGSSLLEVVLATVLLTVALVPAMRLMRSSLTLGREIEAREQLTTFSTSKLEEHLALVGANWLTGDYTGDFAAEGHPTFRFLVRRSDSGGDGGIVDQLMAITATTWEDLDGDGTLDSGEVSVVLGGKVAKIASYQAEAGSG